VAPEDPARAAARLRQVRLPRARGRQDGRRAKSLNIAENLIADATRRIFRDLGDPQAINAARDDAWRAPLWRALEDAGLTRAWVPEGLGGAGTSLADGFEILRISGEFAVAVPLGETLLAGWALSRAGREVPAGELNVDLLKEKESDRETLMLMGAAVRAMQMAGALQAILERSVAYAKERVAFERPIGGFQAVQHNLARLAGETAAALAAAGSAADAIAAEPAFNDAVFLEVASAKIRVGEAATVGAAIAHQVHGAIGFSREHVLHRYTQRLLAWRDDFGSESAWAVRLGEKVASAGADALWSALAAR
jgi:alkylation response protein AidB-like acyl-CoA dehydrogenase